MRVIQQLYVDDDGRAVAPGPAAHGLASGTQHGETQDKLSFTFFLALLMY
jgi:hypothetical protein